MLRNALLSQITRGATPIVADSLPMSVALTPPTARDLRWLAAMGQSAGAVVFVASQDSPELPVIIAGDVLRIAVVGHEPEQWTVVYIVQRAGSALRYVQIFVTPATAP